MERLSLDPLDWTLRPAGDLAHVPRPLRNLVVPARVPGCVHLDLLRAGLVSHPDDGLAELDLPWIGRTDWSYRASFEVPAGMRDAPHLDLVCAGLDTVALITVDGIVIGEAANMHHAHRFDLGEVLRAAGEEHEIEIAFRGPLACAEERERALGERPVNGDWGPYAYLRKSACNFGWDWGPRVPTAGIWRGIEVQAWRGARIAGVRPLVREATADRALLEIEVETERDADYRANLALRATAEGPDGRVFDAETRLDPRSTLVTLHVEIPRPALWWPRGYGEQPLYRLRVALASPAATLDTWEGRTGLRTVRLDTGPDDIGTPFTLYVNDRPVFCHGANWIPDALFPAGLTGAAYRRRVAQAAGANLNMLRVWGGGIYEDPSFYEACDAAGIMVWQDFMFACATYPEEDPYPALIEAEARHVVTRLCRHPSIVLWCGGNENLVAYESWGWKEKMPPGQSWGEAYFFDLLPRVVAELDPSRPYWPDSPYSGSLERHPLEPEHGNRHTWDRRLEAYREIVPRFVSEFGHQGPPNIATFRRAFGADQPLVDSEANRHRQRAANGNAFQYDEPMRERFAVPETFNDWHYLAQLLQARAVSLGLEWLRANRPRCMGAVFWQLNDVWAGHSWSCIDVDGRRKPLWYTVRRAFAPRLLTIHPVDDRPALFAVNDTDERWGGEVRVRRLRFDGTDLGAGAIDLGVEARSASAAGDLLAAAGPPADPREELLVVEADGLRAFWFFAHDRELRLPPPRLRATCTHEKGELVLAIEAETLLRDVIIAVDRRDPAAEMDEQVVTLLPGETRELRISTRRGIPVEQLVEPPVFNCANRFSGR